MVINELEAAREMLEEEYQRKKSEGHEKNKEKSGMSLVDLPDYSEKSVKAKKKAVDTGKIVMKPKSTKNLSILRKEISWGLDVLAEFFH